MELSLIEKNIVILGNFKTEKFDKLFFVKNNVFNENDFLDNSIYTKEFSIIDTKNFTINITQQQIVIISKNLDHQSEIQNIASEIIKKQDDTINAIGYNLKWFMLFENKLNEFTKEIFYSPSNKIINKYFNSDDTIYGYYVSKNFQYSRLKLDVKPLIVQKIETNEEITVLNFDFNFHIVNKYSNLELSKLVSDYENFTNEAIKIINEYE